MIKSFSKFNESVFFHDSEEYKTVYNKYKPSKEEIDEYFIEVSDDRDISYKFNRSYISKIDNGKFTITVPIFFEKHYKIPKTSEDYINDLNTKLIDIKSIKDNCKRFCKSEQYTIIKEEVFSTIDSSNNKPTLAILIEFEKEFTSNSLDDARKIFLGSKSPERISYENLVKILIEMGVREKDADKLIDIHPDHENMEDIVFGFLTNDEIVDIAHFNKETRKLGINKESLRRCYSDYRKGYCSDIIEFDSNQR